VLRASGTRSSAQCDVLMQRRERRQGITAVVRSTLFRDSGLIPTLPDVASELCINPRTLRRRPAEEGTSTAPANP